MIIVVIPSRGRPARAREAVDAALDTAGLETTRVVVVVDADDPLEPDYHDSIHGSGAALNVLSASETGNLVRATNTASMRLVEMFGDIIIGNLGDDHLVRTPDWDVKVEEALRKPGIAYGDDLLQRERLPTAPFISSAIVRALGWYALPTLTHMYIDNVWRDIGTMMKRLVYMPDVIIEHMHPGAGKVENDEGYLRADASTEADRAAYNEWWMTQMPQDHERVLKAVM